MQRDELSVRMAETLDIPPESVLAARPDPEFEGCTIVVTAAGQKLRVKADGSFEILTGPGNVEANIMQPPIIEEADEEDLEHLVVADEELEGDGEGDVLPPIEFDDPSNPFTHLVDEKGNPVAVPVGDVDEDGALITGDWDSAGAPVPPIDLPAGPEPQSAVSTPAVKEDPGVQVQGEPLADPPEPHGVAVEPEEAANASRGPGDEPGERPGKASKKK